MANALAAVVLAVPVVVGAVAGPAVFRVVVPVLAALVLLDFAVLLRRSGNPPVTLAAAVPAVAMPAVVGGDPGGWTRLPPFAAGMTLGAFLIVLLLGRRRRVVESLAGTVLAGLLVGLGAAGLLLLRGLPHGTRWALGFGLLVAGADLAPVAWRAVQRARQPPAGDAPPAEGGPLLTAAVGGVALLSLVLMLGLREPFAPRVALVAGLVALTAAVGAGHLHRAMAAEAGAPTTAAEAFRLGDGLLLAAADAMLLGAPVLYVLARAESL